MVSWTCLLQCTSESVICSLAKGITEFIAFPKLIWAQNPSVIQVVRNTGLEQICNLLPLKMAVSLCFLSVGNWNWITQQERHGLITRQWGGGNLQGWLGFLGHFCGWGHLRKHHKSAQSGHRFLYDSPLCGSLYSSGMKTALLPWDCQLDRESPSILREWRDRWQTWRAQTCLGLRD